jgi:hypothetical protein
LQFAHGPVCGGAEDAVVPPSIEAKFVQSHLQGGHVVASQHVTGPVLQKPFTYAPARLFKAAEGFWADNAVDEEAAVLLKLAHGSPHGLVVGVAVWVRK